MSWEELSLEIARTTFEDLIESELFKKDSPNACEATDVDIYTTFVRPQSNYGLLDDDLFVDQTTSSNVEPSPESYVARNDRTESSYSLDVHASLLVPINILDSSGIENQPSIQATPSANSHSNPVNNDQWAIPSSEIRENEGHQRQTDYQEQHLVQYATLTEVLGGEGQSLNNADESAAVAVHCHPYLDENSNDNVILTISDSSSQQEDLPSIKEYSGGMLSATAELDDLTAIEHQRSNISPAKMKLHQIIKPFISLEPDPFKTREGRFKSAGDDILVCKPLDNGHGSKNQISFKTLDMMLHGDQIRIYLRPFEVDSSVSSERSKKRSNDTREEQQLKPIKVTSAGATVDWCIHENFQMAKLVPLRESKLEFAVGIFKRNSQKNLELVFQLIKSDVVICQQIYLIRVCGYVTRDICSFVKEVKMKYGHRLKWSGIGMGSEPETVYETLPSEENSLSCEASPVPAFIRPGEPVSKKIKLDGSNSVHVERNELPPFSQIFQLCGEEMDSNIRCPDTP